MPLLETILRFFEIALFLTPPSRYRRTSRAINLPSPLPPQRGVNLPKSPVQMVINILAELCACIFAFVHQPLPLAPYFSTASFFKNENSSFSSAISSPNSACARAQSSDADFSRLSHVAGGCVADAGRSGRSGGNRGAGAASRRGDTVVGARGSGRRQSRKIG